MDKDFKKILKEKAKQKNIHFFCQICKHQKKCTKNNTITEYMEYNTKNPLNFCENFSYHPTWKEASKAINRWKQRNA